MVYRQRRIFAVLLAVLMCLLSSVIKNDLDHGRLIREQHGKEQQFSKTAFLQGIKRPVQTNQSQTDSLTLQHYGQEKQSLQHIPGSDTNIYRTTTISHNVLSRPPLDSIVDAHGNITGDPQFLLDFAIIGFGKCGTTTIMHWLADHPEVQIQREEQWHLMLNRPANLIRQLYLELPEGPYYKRGYKSPGDITQKHIIEILRVYWPQTKLIIGVRHPILWFESLYNFRIQNLRPTDIDMLHPNQLIGVCTGRKKNTCTDKANFAYNLIRMGKHNYPIPKVMDELEERIVNRNKRSQYNISQVPAMPNPVFLFDIGQLGDANETRAESFRRDMQRFLGLHTALPKILHFRPGRIWDKEFQKEKDKRKIDICHDEYRPVRSHLLEMSRLSSQWIRTVFLNAHGVHCSSRQYLEQLLLKWMDDPCANGTEIISLPQIIIQNR